MGLLEDIQKKRLYSTVYIDFKRFYIDFFSQRLNYVWKTEEDRTKDIEIYWTMWEGQNNIESLNEIRFFLETEEWESEPPFDFQS